MLRNRPRQATTRAEQLLDVDSALFGAGQHCPHFWAAPFPLPGTGPHVSAATSPCRLFHLLHLMMERIDCKAWSKRYLCLSVAWHRPAHECAYLMEMEQME